MIVMETTSFYRIRAQTPTISTKNIAKTCMKCHAEIEEVHTKIIKKELWEKEPGAIPACTDCHPPHKVNVQNIVTTFSDRACLKCHEKDDIFMTVMVIRLSLQVTKDDIAIRCTKNINCVKCHSRCFHPLKSPMCHRRTS